MQVTVLPRLQIEQFSLYWKEPLSTETKCLEELTLQDVPEDATVQQVLELTGQRLGWQPADKLLRLDGFTEPWERVLCRGRELLPLDSPLKSALQPRSGGGTEAVAAAAGGEAGGEAAPLTLVVVRKVLNADGWKIIQDGDFLSSEDENDEDV